MKYLVVLAGGHVVVDARDLGGALKKAEIAVKVQRVIPLDRAMLSLDDRIQKAAEAANDNAE